MRRDVHGRIGIIGGMGPEAGIALASKILAVDIPHAGSKSVRDQDHLPLVLDSDPRIPDRSAFLGGEGPDPLPAMIAAGRRLESAGATVVGLACMTAHAFIEPLRRALGLRVISAFEELAAFLQIEHPRARRLGILATSGSRLARVYENSLPGLDCLWPSDREQKELVMEAVYGAEGIKAGERGDRPRALLVGAARSLAEAGAELVIAGCTEIPLALSASDIELPLIDPMDILAKALVAGLLPYGTL